MRRQSRAGVLAVAAVATATAAGAGCAATTVTPGEPNRPAPPAAAAAQLPPRPAELRVDEVDPCTLLTPQQQQALGIDSSPRPGTGSSRGEPACHFDHGQSEPFYGFLIAVLPFEGAQAWLTGSRAAEARVLDPVAGFGAVEVRSPDGAAAVTDCSVIVDVAAGQSLDAYFESGASGAFTQDEQCAKARQAAEAATRTLLAG